MSRVHLNAYRSELARLRSQSTGNEGSVSDAFRGLLAATGRKHDLTLVREHAMAGSARGNAIRVDGALMPKGYILPHGYWEAKDSRDRLDDEIRKKLAAGYPDSNIIYEDTVTAVLRQDGREVDRAPTHGDDAAFLRLLDRFFAFETAAAKDFKEAAKRFRLNLPEILAALRRMLGEAESDNAGYRAAATAFLDHAKAAINPSVTADDVREMLIQHILTEEIFTSVFDANFHRENNIAQRLTALEAAFFTGGLRQATMATLKPYYTAIRAAAAATDSPREKQRFIKDLYEGFYKVYNPKAADRLGVVYTPGEIVRFMIRGADWLCEKHFGKCLIDSGVEILDPATGTGTFIVELLEHFAGDRDKLRHKYKEELHANEVAILPYYVANLNIEATYAALTGQYAEFPNLCFVDTLDNTAGLGMFAGHQGDMFGSFSDENIGRIKRQNERRISVIIGNPPYNAWQENYNSRNPNRPYKRVDERIGATYRARSNAQNTSALSDMYVRFYRWVSDRLRDDGIVAFVTNRNFIDKLAFDGFRKSVAAEFAEIWLVDLGGDVRANPKLSGTKHNAMGIQTGLTIAFMVRSGGKRGPARIRYARRPEEETAADKLAWLSDAAMAAVDFTTIRPNAKGVWLNQSDGDWATLLPLADPTAGPGDSAKAVAAIFRLSSTGVKTQRDDWVWSFERTNLIDKISWFLMIYEASRRRAQYEKERDTALARGLPAPPMIPIPLDQIKWDRELANYARRDIVKVVDRQKIVFAQFRPFIRKYLYFDEHLNGMTYRLPHLFRKESNDIIMLCGLATEEPFSCLGANRIFDKGALKLGNGNTFGVPRYRYLPSGERVDNVTDWAVARFAARYPDDAASGAITKDAIFAYVYAALHDPVYRSTYAADLRREFPRIPLHDDFARWVAWGQDLLDLHIGYESVEPFALTRVDVPTGRPPVPKLKSLPDAGVIVLDSDTQLTGVPASAWNYRLGNRSAIDWVLDQHKEKKIKDPTVARLFDTYRFADHKDRVIDLLGRVVAVSLATVGIIEAMRALTAPGAPASTQPERTT